MRYLGSTTLVLLGSLSAACSSESSHGGHGGAHDGTPSSVPVDPIAFDAVFVVNGGDATLSVIDPAKGSAAATILLENASYPHHIGMSADRSKLLVAVPGVDLSGGHAGHHDAEHGGAVMMLDASTGATLLSRVTPAVNHNAAFSPDQDEVWTSQMEAPGSVLVLDAASLETKKSVAVGDGPAEVTFSASGKYAFVANGGSNSVTVIDPETKAVVKTIAVGKNPVGAWQGSNGIAYVDNETDQTLTVIDTATLDVLATYDLGFMPGMAALAPDGSLWVTDSDAGSVVILAADTGMKLGEIATGAGAHAIAFSGDGTMGFVSNQLGDSVSSIDIASGTVVSTTPVGKSPNGILWRAH